MFSRRARSLLSSLSHLVLLLATICLAVLSCATLLSQAVRTDPHRSWKKNYNALIIGAAYAIFVVMSLVFCVNRRIAVRRKLQRISREHRLLGKKDLPGSVHEYICQEYVRTCLVSYESQPKYAAHEGWGRPGTKYAGTRFRRALLDTISEIDVLAHAIIPSHPPLKPHARMLHHFRYITPLLPPMRADGWPLLGRDSTSSLGGRDETLDAPSPVPDHEPVQGGGHDDGEGLTLLHYYDSAIQLARTAAREPTEAEFVIGIRAAREIIRVLDECREEMTMGSTTQLNGSPYPVARIDSDIMVPAVVNPPYMQSIPASQ
ncbi:hypothetical protein PLICRDRAFT_35634 [Plicaturopsis crispa FD-325 SS-3]|nr:hypothetical protein PLICRDRAFT_35634 [Plicaturopsis crispa FD-325 SS-3]